MKWHPFCSSCAVMECPACSSPSSDPLPSERRLCGRLLGGRYLIERLIGAGAMGYVYRALHVELSRACAVKVIREAESRALGSTGGGWWSSAPARRSTRGRGAAGSALEEAVARFRVEARAVSLLDHPNILRLLDFGRDGDGLFYLVTEHLEGEDLIDVLNTEVVLAPPRIVRIMRQVCEALHHAHGAGVIHRDIKPENIRLVPCAGEDGAPVEHVKLIDFGTAKIVSGPGARGLVGGGTAAIEDADRLVIGTPAYMSPEQASGQSADGRSDLYSCGVLLFEMATGRLPFEQSTSIALAAAHVETEPPAPRSIRADVDPALEAVILWCLRKDPAARPQSARELRDALDGVLAPRPRLPALRAASPPRRGRAPARAARVPLAALAAAALGSSMWIALSSEAEAPARPAALADPACAEPRATPACLTPDTPPEPERDAEPAAPRPAASHRGAAPSLIAEPSWP